MSRLEELHLDPDERMEIPWEKLAEENLGQGPIPYPGTYRFSLPAEFDFEVIKRNIKGRERQRIQVNFNQQHPLTIVRATPTNKKHVGMTVNYRLTNAEFPYGKKSAIEMAWLIKAVGGSLPNGASGILDYAKELAKHAKAEFAADVEWTAFCNSERPRYIYDQYLGTNVEDREKGCGNRYALKSYGNTLAIPRKEDGTFAERFKCQCGAELRCFMRLKKYRAVEAPIAPPRDTRASDGKSVPVGGVKLPPPRALAPVPVEGVKFPPPPGPGTSGGEEVRLIPGREDRTTVTRGDSSLSRGNPSETAESGRLRKTKEVSYDSN